MKEKNQVSYTWNSGVRPSTGSGKAHTNTKSSWGWVFPELQISVEESVDIHTSSELWYSRLTIQLDFTDFFNLLHTHPCFGRRGKRKKCDPAPEESDDAAGIQIHNSVAWQQSPYKMSQSLRKPFGNSSYIRCYSSFTLFWGNSRRIQVRTMLLLH